MNPSSMSMQQKIQWLKSQGVSDQAIQSRMSGASRTQVSLPQQQTFGESVDEFTGKIPTTMSTIAGFLPGSFGIAGSGAASLGGSTIQNALQDLFRTPESKARKQFIKNKDLPGLLEEPKEEISKAISTMIGQAAGQLVGKGMSSAGKKIFGWGLKKPAAVAEKEFVKSAGEKGFDLNEEMIKKNLKGTTQTIYNKAKQGMDEAWKAIKTIAGKSGDSGLTVDELANQSIQGSKEILKQPGYYEAAKSGWTEVFKDLKKTYGNKLLTWDDIAELNKVINSKTYTAAGRETTSDAAKSVVYKSIDDFIKPYIKENLPELSDALGEYGLYASAKNIAENTGTKALTTGGPVQNILQAVNIPFKLLKNVPLTTNLGSSLYKGGQTGIPGGLGAYIGNQWSQ